jgi:hypothetical protein
MSNIPLYILIFLFFIPKILLCYIYFYNKRGGEKVVLGSKKWKCPNFQCESRIEGEEGQHCPECGSLLK